MNDSTRRDRPGQRPRRSGAGLRVVLACALLAVVSGTGIADGSDSTAQPCVADDTTLCLNDDRFRVAVRWETDSGSGEGRAVELTGDTGYFWFFSENNVEVVITVLNGCSIGEGAYWVFIGGLTDVRVEVEVEDVEADEAKAYVNEAGTLFRPVTDTAAFSTCD